jgi:hypothetical protein
VKLHHTGLLIIATATLALSAPAAQADTQYGGVASLRNSPSGPLTTLVRHDDGSVTARLVFGYTCRKRSFYNYRVNLKGSTPDGVNFTVSGKERLPGLGTLRFSATGTLAADSAAGTMRMGMAKCPKYTRDLVLRTESAPAGAPSAPPAASLFAGLTGQTASGVRFPVALRVTKQGRIWSSWGAKMKCGPKGATSQLANNSPTTTIKPDGSFSRSETYTIRWAGGSRERYRVSFKGRFVADGAVGTLRARSQLYKKGHRYYPCDSGTQAWAARM